jgi:hypothetical protein
MFSEKRLALQIALASQIRSESLLRSLSPRLFKLSSIWKRRRKKKTIVD